MAPVLVELKKFPDVFEPILVHTGQHYDHQLSTVFFEDLGLPLPDHYLGVPVASSAAQTAAIIDRFDELCEKEKFDRVLLVGDVTSTLACAVAAAKRLIPLDHIEAGLRSFDRTMPEEINRLVTDSLADLCFVSEPSGVRNLRREGRDAETIKLVGNVMIDTLHAHLPAAKAMQTWDLFQLVPKEYGVVTLHRPSNVDDPVRLGDLILELGQASHMLPLIFPIHPRTRRHLVSLSLKLPEGIRLVDPLGYRQFLGLMAEARLVVTDSGGIQEETTALRVPCLTVRRNTERPITVSQGTSTLVPELNGQLCQLIADILAGHYKKGSSPKLWDGNTSQRIVSILRTERGFVLPGSRSGCAASDGNAPPQR